MVDSDERKAFLATLDGILDYMLEAKGKGPSFKTKLPPEAEVRILCKLCGDILLQQEILLDLVAPINVVGDIHGQYHDLLRLFDFGGFPPATNYLFLGDYVDRGKNSLEVMIMLLAYKVKYPLNFFLLRGNHECAAITRIYGFYDECKRRFNIKVWKLFCDVFNKLPLCAQIDERIFCVHGGLSPEIQNIDQIKKISRPTDVPDVGMVCDFLWGDPDIEISGWAENDRGVSYIFGPDVVSNFCKKYNFDFVVRAHQVVAEGFEFFGPAHLDSRGNSNLRSLITLFSAPNYCGEFDNAAAMMIVDDNLCVSFKVLQPVGKLK